MNKIEKRELVEQQQKIFEAGAQRVDKRTGSFSFLTWSFFIAPLIACEAFLAASFKSAAATEQEDAKATQVGASHQANDKALASDPGKTSADDETAKGAAASAQAHATGIDPTALLLPENAPKPITPRSEAVAAASGDGDGGRGGGNNGDNTDSRHHDAHTSIDDSSVDSLSVHSYLEDQSSGGSTFAPAQSNVLGDSFCPPVMANNTADTLAPVEAAVPPVLTTVTDTVGTLTSDVADTLAPVEAAVPPVLTAVSDTVGTLTSDVADTLAPVEAAVPPVLTAVTDTVGTLTSDVADTLAPVEAAVPPVLTAVTDTVGTLTSDVADTLAPVEAAVPPVLTAGTDTVGTLTSDVADTLAPVEAAVPPVLTAVSDTVGTLTSDVADTLAPVEAAVPPVLTAVSDTVGTLTSDVADTLAPVEAAVPPVLTAVTDTVGTLTSDVADTLAPVEAAVPPVLTAVTDTVGTLTSDVADTLAPVEAAVPPVLTTGTDTVGTLTSDVADTLAPVEAAVPPVLTAVTDTVGTLTSDVADTLAPVEAAVPPLDQVGNLAAHAPAAAVDPALPPTPSDDTDSSSHGVTDVSKVAEHPIGTAGSVTPVLPDSGELQTAAPDTTSGLANHAVGSASEPAVDTADPLLAPMTGAANQSTALSQPTTSDDANAHALGNSAPVFDVTELAPATGSGAADDAVQPGDVASDALASAAPVVDTTEPVLANAGVSPSDPAGNLVQPSVPDTSTDHSSGPADTLMALATATDAPIEVPEATAAPANAAASVDPPAIAGDVIALNDAPQPPANALFTGTQYTDYGITLSSDIAVPPQQSAPPADAASAHDASEPVVAAQKDAPPPPDIVDTTHQIDHLGHAML